MEIPHQLYLRHPHAPEELPGYVESLRSLQEKYKNQISIKIGLECEYFPEYIHWLKGIIKEYKLDYIIFGNHHFHTDEKFPISAGIQIR